MMAVQRAAAALAPGRALDAAVAVLDPQRWEIPIAEDRPRAAAGTDVDAVIRARCRA